MVNSRTRWNSYEYTQSDVLKEAASKQSRYQVFDLFQTCRLVAGSFTICCVIFCRNHAFHVFTSKYKFTLKITGYIHSILFYVCENITLLSGFSLCYVIIEKIKVYPIVIFIRKPLISAENWLLYLEDILDQENFTTSSYIPGTAHNCCWWRSRKSADFFIMFDPWYLKNERWIKIRDLGF